MNGARYNLVPSLALIFLLPVCPAYARSSKPIKCMNEIRTLSLGMESFKESEGVFPPEKTWAELLMGHNVNGLNKQRLTYIPPDTVDTIDPWGNKYIYRYPAQFNTNSFDLYSLGQDGISESGGNDEDDINNWDPDHPWLYKAYGFASNGKFVLKVLTILICLLLVAGALLGFLSRRSKARS